MSLSLPRESTVLFWFGEHHQQDLVAYPFNLKRHLKDKFYTEANLCEIQLFTLWYGLCVAVFLHPFGVFFCCYTHENCAAGSLHPRRQALKKSPAQPLIEFLTKIPAASLLEIVFHQVLLQQVTELQCPLTEGCLDKGRRPQHSVKVNLLYDKLHFLSFIT